MEKGDFSFPCQFFFRGNYKNFWAGQTFTFISAFLTGFVPHFKVAGAQVYILLINGPNREKLAWGKKGGTEGERGLSKGLDERGEEKT